MNEMQIFYTPDAEGNEYWLNETESKHCVRVLRLKEGSMLHLSNGKGTLFKAEITDANPKACKLSIIEKNERYQKRSYNLHIAIAPTKNIERFEWFLEKSTEIGIDRITPILCERSERKQIKPERLERVLIAAMKQSIKAYKPLLSPLLKFKDFISHENHTVKLIAHCHEGSRGNIKNLVMPGQDVTVLIGPEGDFSPAEIELALGDGYKPLELGKSRLRTETAGMVACHSVAFINYA